MNGWVAAEEVCFEEEEEECLVEALRWPPFPLTCQFITTRAAPPTDVVGATAQTISAALNGKASFSLAYNHGRM